MVPALSLSLCFLTHSRRGLYAAKILLHDALITKVPPACQSAQLATALHPLCTVKTVFFSAQYASSVLLITSLVQATNPHGF